MTNKNMCDSNLVDRDELSPDDSGGTRFRDKEKKQQEGEAKINRALVGKAHVLCRIERSRSQNC